MTCIYSVKIFSMMSVPISCFPDLYKTNVKFWKLSEVRKKLIIMIKQSILHWVKHPKNSEPEWREIRD